jgi:hypothetical protein
MKTKLFITISFIFLSLQAHADWAREQIGLTDVGPRDCSGVVIAYLDTGVNINSPYLRNAIWTNPNPTNGDIHGYDFVHSTGVIGDKDGHGTKVAHIMAADTGDPDTVGVCSKAQIMVLKIADSGQARIESIKGALNYAIEKKAQIILTTTGLIMQGGLPPFGIKNLIAKATKNGALFIHSAANLSAIPPQGATHPHQLWPFLVPDRFHPIRGAIAVGGSTSEDLPWLGGFRHPSKVHVAAPAENIRVVKADGEVVIESGNSLAAGFAAGMAAAYWTAHPEKSALQVLEALKASSEKREAYLYEMDSGRLDLPRLLYEQFEDRPQFEVLGQMPLEGGTEHPYAAPQVSEWTFSKPGAKYVRLIFGYISLGNCWSRTNPAKVTILDRNRRPIQEFVCENRARGYRLPSVWAEGDTITVLFESQETSNQYWPGVLFRSLEWGRKN